MAEANGYNGLRPATVTFTLANTVTITGGVDTGVWPTESHAIVLALEISGKVYGRGGRGGAGGSLGEAGGDGGAGGDAITCHLPLSITIDSGAQVRGGGGGGGGWPNGQGGAGGNYGDTLGGNGGAATINGGGGGGSTGGGAGGAMAAAGANGAGFLSPPTPGGTAGVAGYAIRKNGHTVSVTNNGATSGTIG